MKRTLSPQDPELTGRSWAATHIHSPAAYKIPGCTRLVSWEYITPPTSPSRHTHMDRPTVITSIHMLSFHLYLYMEQGLPKRSHDFCIYHFNMGSGQNRREVKGW